MLFFISKKGFLIALICSCFFGFSQTKKEDAKFKVIAFYTAKNDQAHISFVHEANKWFPKMAEVNHFEYDSTSNWDNMNAEFLANYQVVLFLDTRPETQSQREAFQKFMENGGGWIGFHFSAFALNDSDYPQNWDWYHNTFLGSGEYGSNTWRPTSAVLRVENKHQITRNIPKVFTSAPNEWYRWSNDLRKNPDIQIILAIDESSFPLGTGPKQNEIWHNGYYPVVWTNKNYKMLYVNMGHNDIDYENGTNKTLSYTFENKAQSQLILNSLLWVGKSKNKTNKDVQ
ncbi:ThuA domain-containing protein [Flavobacterium sp. JLP]|uniref:ThuA domain-containing protein n=1 Tax=unclassified Flavobacterium TaxID=196869 RepID=UPI0004934F44|nr:MULTISPECIES: ThuA domain-containing protein [unclassified Flavobacterium]MBF4491578.1 ThuA domain-containing protein [Flavobacterium sp. MR2016-29]MBF4505602.1 ThuA domain-containing protein [Flavobacterium sp. JLP]